MPPTNSQYSPQEMGHPGPPPPAGLILPPGGGGASVPQFLSFQSIYNFAGDLFRWNFDEALQNSLANALAMENDPVIYSALNDRKLQTAQISWHIEPDDETNPAEVEAAAAITKTIERMPNRQQYRMTLLEALWYGKSAAQMIYKWDFKGGRKRLKPVDWWPVNGDKIRGNGAREIGIFVYAAAPVTWIPSDLGPVHMLTPEERQQFVVHSFEPRDANWTQPGFTGQVMGCGLRSRIYWFWWLKSNVFAMLTNYLERFSQGLTVFYYDAHNPQAKAEMIEAAQAQWSKTIMVLPRWSETRDTNSIERHEVGTASPALLENLVTGYFDSEIRRAILHQDLTTGTAPTGLGSGVAMAHADTMSRVVKYDAIDLQETEQRDLVDVLYRWDYPDFTPGRIVYEVDDPNAEELLANAQIFYEMGGQVDLDHLAKTLGLPAPTQGSQVGAKVGGMQAAAIDTDAPAGVPVVGQPGPMPAGVPGPVPQGAPMQMSRRGRRALAAAVKRMQRN